MSKILYIEFAYHVSMSKIFYIIVKRTAGALALGLARAAKPWQGVADSRSGDL